MTSDKSAFERPIRFYLHTSKWMIALIYSIHFGALVCTYFSNITLLLMQMIFLIILISLVYWHYRYIYQLEKTPVQLLLNEKDEWYISNKKCEMDLAVLLPESFVHTYLIVLEFNQDKRKRSAILTFDNIPEATFRRLSVRLRFAMTSPEH